MADPPPFLNSDSDTGDDTRVGGGPWIDHQHTTLGEGVWDYRHRPGPAVCHPAPRR